MSQTSTKLKTVVVSSSENVVIPASVFSQSNMKFQNNIEVPVSITLNELRLLTDLLYTIELYAPLHPDLVAVRTHFESTAENIKEILS